MALDAVVEDILASSKSKVAEINAETEQEVARILNEARERAAEIKSEKEGEADSAVEALERRVISSAHLQVKRAELNVRKDLMDETRKKLVEAVSKLPEKENENLIKEIVKPYNLKEMKVKSSKKDEAFVSSLAPNFVGTVDTAGGVVIESEDGSMSYDHTYETLASEAFSKSMKDVSKILFG
ncbi:V-type ATP synthase subunit E family protein [Methanotrichaceae archaeon M04Ac]|uniref:A-type ATP synthase subunit E n=1 Tax=Candidatus Methanocrinis alkalitolerans TaxID=3033395 RepID=A0ABT5XCM0_9EURY|nr:V-type ATP synthase subunit E family protein [Candidatus Methanocrinis alkalitolerans]MCR3884199.1 V-type ATP synthase subunit E family protein [Methanothrix sp.]MDF0592464.1 V-type ATP synthase subunit E family protein [Candidatus Methanocrinis alkalitolerans]